MQKGKNGFPAVVKLSEMSMHVCSKKHQQPAPTVALGLGVVPINMFFLSSLRHLRLRHLFRYLKLQ